MNFVLLGAGKTGSVVAEIARERGHTLRIVEVEQNKNGAALTRDSLAGVDAVIDFTTPHAVIGNVEACARAGCNIVVGTTGWYQEIPRIKVLVNQTGIGFLFASNFSIGVNVFFQIARAAAATLKHGYAGTIMERHHEHKKDSPSGTAVTLQQILKQYGGKDVEIGSVREGETVGLHVMMFDSESDSMMMTHDAKNRRGFAEGAVRAAEWIAGKKGFYEFKDIFDQL